MQQTGLEEAGGRRLPIFLQIGLYGLLLALIAGGVYWLIFQNRDHRKEYAARFIRLDIRGGVRAIAHNRGETYLFLDSVANPLYIPVESASGGQEFASYAQKGDSVLKRPNSRLIKVKKARQGERAWRLAEGYY